MITKPKPFCFVLMPFDKSFSDIYEFGIKGSCEDAECYCERVDEQVYDGSVLDRIYNQISRADIVIADMSGKNANVFYEVGYAHALGKRTILLTKNSSDIPFDLKHFPHIIYDSQIVSLKTELTKWITKFISEPVEKRPHEIGLELYWLDKPISDNKEHPTEVVVSGDYPEFTLYNASVQTFDSTNFSIGIISKLSMTLVGEAGDWMSETKLPNGDILTMLPIDEKLFPGAYTSLRLKFHKSVQSFGKNTVSSTIRIFTSFGYRDFRVSFIAEKL